MPAGERESKSLRLEIAEDGSGVADGDLDVGLELEASAFEDGGALLKHASYGVELAVQGCLQDGEGVVEDKAV